MKLIKLSFYLVFTIFFSSFLSPAAAEGIYTVENVLIEAAGNNATEARMKALEEGQSKAFGVLLQKLNVPSFAIPPVEAARMVQGFELTNERISTTTYRASLTVSFNPDAVRAFLHKNNVSGQAAAPSALLLPLFKQGNNVLLWEEGENPWNDALTAALQSNRNNSLKLPFGDLDDVTQLPIAAVQAANFSQMRAVAAKYGAENIIIAQAETTNNQTLTVILTTVNATGTISRTLHFTATEGESLTMLLKRAAQEATAPAKPKETVAPLSPTSKATLTIHFANREEWIRLHKKLSSLPAIQRLDVKTISIERAVVEISFAGTQAALHTLLEKQGINTKAPL